MKKIFILILCFIFLGGINVSATDTNLLNEDLITVKEELDTLYYKASQSKKLSKSDMAKLSQIRTYADQYRKDNNTNIVPVFYKLGNTYRVLNMDEDAIHCYRVITKHYPYTPLGRKATMDLKYYGETETNEYGRTVVTPKDDDDN